MRLPTQVAVWLIFGLRSRRPPCLRAWLQRGLPRSQQQCPLGVNHPKTAGKAKLMAKVFIGVDPHKLSATIEVVDDRETVLATGRFGTDKAGYAAMRKHVAAYRSGCGRSRAATAPGGHWRSGCWPTASTSWTCPAKLSCPGAGCSTPGTTARPTPTTRTPWPWSRCAPRRCGCWPTTVSSRRCGCWWTAATS
jgi:hypothetical protein